MLIKKLGKHRGGMRSSGVIFHVRVKRGRARDDGEDELEVMEVATEHALSR